MKIVIGTAQFGSNYGIANSGGKVSADEVRKIIDFAESKGIDTLDTAIAYGESEKILGEIGVASWKIISKLPEVNTNRAINQSVRELFKTTLDNLKIDKLDGLLLHRPEQLFTSEGESLYRALDKLKSDCRLKKIGVSIYHPDELEKILDSYDMDIVQAPFNLIDRRILTGDWIAKLKKRGIELHVRSVFLQGLLLMAMDQRPAKFNKWSKLWNDYDQWLRNSGLTALQACLRYVFSVPEVDKIIVGIDCLEHLEEIVAAIRGTLPTVPQNISCTDLDLVNPVNW